MYREQYGEYAYWWKTFALNVISACSVTAFFSLDIAQSAHFVFLYNSQQIFILWRLLCHSGRQKAKCSVCWIQVRNLCWSRMLVFNLRSHWLFGVSYLTKQESSNRPFFLMEMKKAEVVSHNLYLNSNKSKSNELHRTLWWAWTISRSLIYKRINPFFHLAVFFSWFTIINYLIRLQAILTFLRRFFLMSIFKLLINHFSNTNKTKNSFWNEMISHCCLNIKTSLWRFVRSTCIIFLTEIRLLKGKRAFSNKNKTKQNRSESLRKWFLTIASIQRHPWEDFFGRPPWFILTGITVP